MRSRIALFCMLVASVSACGDDAGSNGDFPSRDGLYGDNVIEVKLEVDYAPNAEPYTTSARGNPWALFRANAEAIFEGTGWTLTVPDELAAMEALPAFDGQDFDSQRILDIADAHWDDRGNVNRRVFYVVFLDGYFHDAEGRREDVIGVSIGDTGVIAMFKPVIDGGLTSRFVEQTTLIHEFGHAIGLVNNGIPMVEPHHDAPNDAHCTNDRCVMFWLNEGASDAVEFANRFVLTGETVVFDGDCVADIRAAFASFR